MNKLFDIYCEMYRIRLIEQKIALEYPKGEIRCPTHLSIGQELLPALFKFSARQEDYAVSTHRSHAHYLAKGGDLNSFIAELYGKKTGCSSGNGGSMHHIDLNVNFMGSTAIVGNTIPIGVGLAQACKMKNDGTISFIFLGEGAVEEGVFYESINYSAVSKIPAVFLCENNRFSVYASLEARQPQNRSLTSMVSGIGIKSLKLDRYKPLTALMDLQDALQEVRITKLPLFVEIDTFRFLEHCGPNIDDHLKYRDPEYVKYESENDPLKLIEEELKETYINFEENFGEFRISLEESIEAAFQKAKEDDFPDFGELENMIFETI